MMLVLETEDASNCDYMIWQIVDLSWCEKACYCESEPLNLCTVKHSVQEVAKPKNHDREVTLLEFTHKAYFL